MKRRLFSILTALALCLGLLPPRAFAADTYSGILNFAPEYDSMNISPASGSGYEWDETSKTLTLTDFHQETSLAFGIVLPADSTLVLNGENTITLGDNPQVGVACWGSLALAGGGALTVTSSSGASPQYGAAYARGPNSSLTFDGYICQDLGRKSVENTIQKTVLQCLADKDKNILSSVAPAAKVDKPDGSSLDVAVLASAFGGSNTGATVTLLRDASMPGQFYIRGDFQFYTNGYTVSFGAQSSIGRLVIAGGTFRMNGDLSSDQTLFYVDGGTLVLENGAFTAGICVKVNSGKLEIPDGANVTLKGVGELTSTALRISGGSAALRGGSFDGNVRNLRCRHGHHAGYTPGAGLPLFQ